MIKYLITGCSLLFLVSCSDGTQMTNQIRKIIKERSEDDDKSNDITQVVFALDGVRHTFPVDKKLDSLPVRDQFLVLDDLYVNLSFVKSIGVEGNVLEVRF